jgi:hypothetical protein
VHCLPVTSSVEQYKIMWDMFSKQLDLRERPQQRGYKMKAAWYYYQYIVCSMFSAVRQALFLIRRGVLHAAWSLHRICATPQNCKLTEPRACTTKYHQNARGITPYACCHLRFILNFCLLVPVSRSDDFFRWKCVGFVVENSSAFGCKAARSNARPVRRAINLTASYEPAV